MYSFYNGGLRNNFDNYFIEIASVYKYQTRLDALQKYYLPRMKMSLGQLSLKNISPKIWSNILENLKYFLSYLFGKHLARIPVDFGFACMSLLVILCWCPNIPPIICLDSSSPHPLYIGMLLTHCFCVVVVFVYFTWCQFDAFCYFFTTCETPSMKNWFMLATGLAENLTQVVFHQPFVIQHVRTRSLNH